MKKLIIIGALILALACIGLLAGCWTIPGPVTDETEAIDIKALWGVYDLTGYNSATVNSVMASYNTPQKIVSYMASHFTDQSHSAAWSPYNFYKYKWGDCNDFATYGIYCAYKVAGYQKWMLQQAWIKFASGQIHMLALYGAPWNPGYCYSSDMNYHYARAAFYNWHEVIDHCQSTYGDITYAKLYSYDCDYMGIYYP